MCSISMLYLYIKVSQHTLVLPRSGGPRLTFEYHTCLSNRTGLKEKRHVIDMALREREPLLMQVDRCLGSIS